jgi:hypothetical protein
MIVYIKNNPQQVLLSAILFLCILIGLFLRLEVLDAVIVNEWVLRDFDRAFNLVDGNYIPLAGPEATNGGRLPGPFLYFLLSIPILFHYSYDSIFNFNLFLNIASIGVLFFALKKFFGHTFSSIVSALVCLNTYHIAGVFFPINPSFIFLFVSLFIWFFLEFTLKNKVVFFSLQVLAVLLAIQMHYTMALFTLASVFSIIVFKIKIPLKHLFLIAGICIVSFTPYFIYKQLFYYLPINLGSGAGVDNYSLLNVFKAFAIPNTILNITSNSAGQYWSSPVEISSTIGQIAIYISILTLILFIFSKYKNNDLVSCKKQLAVFLLFYVPAFNYEIVNPQLGHYWYAFIFVIPTAILLTQAGVIIFDLLKGKVIKSIFLFLVFFLFISKGYLSIAHVEKNVDAVKDKIFRSVFEGSFKNYQKMLGSLMVQLSLNPKLFSERVYFFDTRPSSIKRLEFAYNKLNQKQKESISKSDQKTCYLLLNHSSSRGQVKKSLLKTFLDDKSIYKNDGFKVSFDGVGFSEFLNVIPYKPEGNRSCYNNIFNSFVVNKKVRSMLSEVKPISKNENFVLMSKSLLKKESYDKNNKLIKFDGSYVFLNKISGLPFQLDLSIKKQADGYHVRSDIISVFFWRNRDFHFSRLKLNFLPKTAESPWTLIGKNELINPIIILPEKTLASSVNNMANVSDWSYNQFWYEEEVVPTDSIALINGQFALVLSIIFHYDESSHCCASNLTHEVAVPLI